MNQSSSEDEFDDEDNIFQQIKYYYNIRVEEEQIEKEEQLKNIINLKMSMIIDYFLESMNKDKILKSIQKLYVLLQKQDNQLQEQFIELLSSFKTQYNRLNLKQIRSNYRRILINMIFQN
ncbi:hypothetical protein pb186bvf_013772 [Paramecium bursaria]